MKSIIFGLANDDSCPSVMNSADAACGATNAIKQADVAAVNKNFGPNRNTECGADVNTGQTCLCPVPTPTPTPPGGDGGCDPAEGQRCTQYGGTYDYSSCYCSGGRCDYEAGENFCDSHGGDWIPSTCTCHYSPIIIDVVGDGFELTDNANGVLFDLDRDGTRKQLSWTAPGSDDAFLLLDC